MLKIEQYFSGIVFSGADQEKIVNAFELEFFKKNDFIVEEGKTSRYIGFVETGMFQYYVIKNGEEITTYVSIANTWFASVLSFVSEKPSLENIKALVDGSIHMISKTNLKMLVNEIPAFKDFYI